MKKSIIVLLAMSVPTLVFAGLGDTKVSTEAKFGQGKPTFLAQEFSYEKEGWIIHELFNDFGICVVASYTKLTGSITEEEASSLNSNNFPGYTLNPGSNGWVTERWPDRPYSRDSVSSVWTNGKLLFQVIAEKRPVGEKWFECRHYYNDEGVALMHKDLEDYKVAHPGVLDSTPSSAQSNPTSL